NSISRLSLDEMLNVLQVDLKDDVNVKQLDLFKAVEKWIGVHNPSWNDKQRLLHRIKLDEIPQFFLDNLVAPTGLFTENQLASISRQKATQPLQQSTVPTDP